MSWVVVAGLVAVGVVAGSYARALAEGFELDAEDVRGEAREAFLGALRGWPVPRAPYLVEAGTGVVFGVLGWRFGGSPLLFAMVYTAFVGVVLAVVDWRTWRLPDAVTLPSYLIVIGLLAPSGQVVVGLACGLALGAVYLILWLGRPTGIGLGDVKLAGVLGIVTGAVSVNAAIIAGVGAHLLGALYAIGLLLMKKGDRKSEFPFGPFMIFAAFVAVVVEA
ncbi:prepilin peptidase [Acrocarpospora pleiomorpha]|uniref:prepilin peptidase n=1 Tax=Acrocarpospora pleiomorpha TaxID=90975 RepID=UPI0012D3719E|nr:A24 family peptidase [Acrocarpospora pleiomorpha]